MYKPEGDLEFKSAFSCTSCKFRYTTVVHVTASVEYDCGYASCLCSFSNKKSNLLCSLLISAGIAEILFISGSGSKRYAINVVNDLRLNVLKRTEYAKTRAGRCSGNLSSYSGVSLFTLDVTVSSCYHLSPLLSIIYRLFRPYDVLFHRHILHPCRDRVPEVSFHGSEPRSDQRSVC